MSTHRLPTALLLVALVVPVSAGAQSLGMVDAPTIKGAHGLIIVPENWNGSLFLYAHGYSADERLLQPFPTDVDFSNFAEKLPLLFQAVVLPTLFGYASATTTFRSAGWYVEDAVKDIENLRRYFVKKHGKPKYTYAWGHSGGGMVTSTVIEYGPKTYDGALPMCGPGAGARRNFDGAFDLRVLYDYLCREVAGAAFGCRLCTDGKSRCLREGDCPAGQTCGDLEPAAPLEDGLTRECTEFLLDHPDRFSEDATDPGGDFVSAPVNACFGSFAEGAPAPSPEQAARRSFFVRASQIPESFIPTDMFFATIGMGEVVHRRTGGRHAWGNTGVEYASPLLSAAERDDFNAKKYEASEDASAVRYMRRFYEPKGKTEAKVITVHALDDGLVIPENEDKYRQAFEAAGRSDQLVQLFTSSGGHCGFINAIIPAMVALTAWVEQGVKPTPPSVAAACPGCGFTPEMPGPWGTKVVERKQKGAPVRSLVCGGDPGDCPEGATCSERTLHCR